MSFEIGAESLPRRHPRRPTNRVDTFYPGLGATGILALAQRVVAAPPSIATAPWMQGLPGPGNDADKTRIAYAKRDHDLAMPPRNDTAAYNNLKSQAVGSATKVGKAWYGAALADVNRVRSFAVQPPLVNPIISKPVLFKPPPTVYVTPILKEAADMGLKIQQTSDGSVVAVNSDGAVVSKPLPVPVSAVTDKTVLPPNTVQATAPPPNRTPGVFSILDRLTDAFTGGGSSSSGGSSFIPSQGPPPATTTGTAPSFSTADMTGGVGGALGELFKNPAVLAGGALLFYLLFMSSSSGRR